MNIIKQNLERAFFTCPEINMRDCRTYPEASEAELEAMYCSYLEEPDRVCMFPFVRKTGEGEPYVEIYTWDKMLHPDLYTRFIIREGYRMPEEEEEAFLCYTESNPRADDGRTEYLNEQIPKLFPQWNYRRYEDFQLETGMQHMYFASHRSGCREILYKAGLANIAFQLDSLPEYNAIGSTPEKIVGHEIPIRMLRMLDQTEAIRILFDVDETERCIAAYRMYSGYIGNRAPSLGQWKYLEALAFEKGGLGRKSFWRTLYWYLEGDYTTSRLEKYREYFRYIDALPEYRRMKLPRPDEILGAIEMLDTIQEYSQDKSGLNDMFKARKRTTDLEYFSDRYSVIMPESTAEFCREAVIQRNCLMEYIEDHAAGKTTILFIRKTNSRRQPFVTMEIDESDHSIVQVYARFNELPKPEVYRFLEEYARKKWLKMNPVELVLRRAEDLDEFDVDWPEDIRTYLTEYLERTASGNSREEPEPDGYIQLTLADVFPGLWEEAG